MNPRLCVSERLATWLAAALVVTLPCWPRPAFAADAPPAQRRDEYMQPTQQDLQRFKQAAPRLLRPAPTPAQPAKPTPTPTPAQPAEAAPSPAPTRSTPAKAPTSDTVDCAAIADAPLRASCETKVQALRRPTAIVVSGGVSLGSHQGGVLFYLTQFLGAYRQHVRAELGDSAGPDGGLTVAAGASAGSINAFLAAMSSCRDEVIDPRQSLFYTTWIPVGMRELANSADVSSSAVLSRAPIDAAICRVRHLWEDQPKSCAPAAAPVSGAWSEAPCAGQLAFDVTRVKARELPLTSAGSSAEPLKIKRQTEQFLVRYDKPAGRAAPVFYPVRPPRDKALDDLYPVLGDRGYDDPIALDHVFALLKASSSFPVAFEPVTVPHWLPANGGATTTVGRVDDTSRFIDGGVFDNSPLGIAMTLSEWRGQDPYLVFVEPDAVGFKSLARDGAASQPEPHQTVFGVYGDFISDFVAVSRQAEILSALARNPAVRQTLQVPPRKLPSASGHLLNFLGFFETDFRRFDFYLGMTDAWDYLRRVSNASAVGDGTNQQYAVLNEARRLPSTTDSLFACFVALRKREPDDFFRHKAPDPGAVPECARVAEEDANLLATYRAARDLRKYLQTPGADPSQQQAKFFTALDNHHFAFKDLDRGGDLLTADQAVAQVRDDMQLLVHTLGSHQPGALARKGASVVGKAAANELRYRTPRHTLELWGAINSSGLGADYLLSNRSGLRLQVGALVEPWQKRHLQPAADAPASWTSRWGSRLAVGYEHALSNRWQLSLAAGAELRSITQNHDGALSLVPDEQLLWRYGPVALLRVTLYQRLSFGLTYVHWLDDCAGNNACQQAIARAASLRPIASEAGVLSFTIGWRLLDLFFDR